MLYQGNNEGDVVKLRNYPKVWDKAPKISATIQKYVYQLGEKNEKF